MIQIFCDYRCRRICAHTSCIWSFITIISGLMILRCSKRQNFLTICYNNKTCFFSVQEFFYNDLRTSLSKIIFIENILNSCNRLVNIHSDYHTLASCQSICFNNQRCPLFINIVDCCF